MVLAPMDQPTMHAVVQRNSGIGAEGTGESVTLGKVGKRKRWDSQQASSSLHYSGRNVYGSQAMRLH